MKDKNLVQHRVKHDNFIYYIGISDNIKKVGTFLIKLNKEKIENSNIYFTKENINIENLKKNFDQYIRLFKKIIPYTGQEERKKFKGE